MELAYVSTQLQVYTYSFTHKIIIISHVLLLPASKLAENGFRVTVTNYNKENVSQIDRLNGVIAVKK